MSPKRVDKDEKRATIVDAAKKIFSRKGYNAATMEDISYEAGIAKGTTYLYFGSKEELFLAVFDWYVEEMMGKVMEIPRNMDGGAIKKVDVLMEKTLASVKKNKEMFPLYMEFWSASALGEQRAIFGDYMRKIYKKNREVIEEIIKQGKNEGVFKNDIDNKAAASILVGAYQGLLVQACLEPELELERMIKLLMQNLLRDIVISEK